MRIVYLIFTLVLITVKLNAQEIYGTIKNEKGESLPYASIYLKKSKIGGYSDEKGKFHLSSKKSIYKVDTLMVQYVGYQKYSVSINLLKPETQLSVVLKSSIKELDEFVLVALPKYTPKTIVQKAIKNTRKNYVSTQTISEGFYREIVKQEDKWIVLNEAAIQVKYDSYPQKHFLNQAIRAYYSYSTLPWNMFKSSVFIHLHRFTSFIPIKKDQVKIVNSRVSYDLASEKIETSPVGGPGDLLALDKVKYRYDFFDPKMIKKYHYKNVGRVNLNGENCYIIDFYPKKEKEERVHQAFSKKMKYAIYVGRIYISTKTFAVVSFQFQFTNNVDFSVYNKHYGIPDFIYVNVDYKKHNGKWMLNEVSTEQRDTRIVNQKITTFTCLRTLKLAKPQIKKVNFAYDSTAFITKSTTLRDFYQYYDSGFWNAYEKTNAYPPLKPKVLTDLGKATPLIEQFESVNTPVDSFLYPIAKKTNIDVKEEVSDVYHWMRNANDSSVTHYLEMENEYYNKVMVKLSDNTRGFYYRLNNMLKPLERKSGNNSFNIDNVECKYILSEEKHVELYKVQNDSLDVLILDKTKEGMGLVNFWIEKIKIIGNNKVVFMYSQKGNITNTLKISEFGKSNALDEITDVVDFTTLSDSIFLYLKTNQAGRSYQLRSFNLKSKADVLMYEESDVTFDLSLETTTSGKHTFLVAANLDVTEWILLTADMGLQKIVFREEGDNCTINHFKNSGFYVVSTIGENNTFSKFSLTDPKRIKWEVIYTTPFEIEDFYITKNYAAIQEYHISTFQLMIVDLATKKKSELELDEPICYFSFNKNPLDSNNIISLEFESPKTPYITYLIDLENKSKQILQKGKLMQNSGSYKVETRMIKTEGGLKIPLTLFYDEAQITDSIKGVILSVYGAYGSLYYPFFDAGNKVYVDMGYIIAYAHVRGGGELGNDWYQNGKLNKKINTFTDYVSCAKYILEKYKIEPNKLTGSGSSAGGLVMGYVANNYPELFGTLIFDRPYLDVINTMLDSSIALTTMEYDEWGNPRDSSSYAYINSYSPYQNITKKTYPNMIFFTGFYDEQAPYWQVANSVAKYRENNEGNGLILLHTNMSGGHRGSVNTTFPKQGNKFSIIKYSTQKK